MAPEFTPNRPLFTLFTRFTRFTLAPVLRGEARVRGLKNDNLKSQISNFKSGISIFNFQFSIFNFPLALLSLLLFLAPLARAQDYPLLEELNRQTQSLYRDVQSGLVRVQLPVPRWVREAADRDDPLKKWPALDPAIRRTLEAQRDAALRGPTTRMSARILPTTRPLASADAQGWKITKTPAGETILEPRGPGASPIIINAGGDLPVAPGSPLRNRPPIPGQFVPNNIGLLLDDAGHILIPIYIEPEMMSAPVRVTVGDADATATFVGSDDKTQLTILKLDKPAGRPVRMSGFRPAGGAMVMLLNPNSGEGRLAIWTGGQRDYGVVVGMDGSVAGIVRYGQLLGGPACKVVIDQLIKTGHIRRAVLGATLTEVDADDPVRRQNAELGDHPAILIEQIAPDSLAQRFGLKKGDFILEIAQEPVGDLTTWAAHTAAGGEARLLILRDGVRQEVRVMLQPE
jgi:hypothetical protein